MKRRGKDVWVILAAFSGDEGLWATTPPGLVVTDEVLADYPDLVADDVPASLEYAAFVTRTRSSVPISAA